MVETEPFFPGKFIFAHIWAKRTQNGPKAGFFLDFLKNFAVSFSWKQSKMNSIFVIDVSPPIPYLSKFRFSSFRPYFCWPVKLQDYLKCEMSRKKEI